MKRWRVEGVGPARLEVAALASRRAVLGLTILLFAWFSAANAAPHRVLIVHSFGSAAPPFTTHSMAFETELTQKIGEQVDLDEVSLDMARYGDPDMQEALVEYILKRHAKWQPDLVVPIGSPAGVFVAQYRDRLFPETPVIYTGMDGRRLPPGALQKNATFVGEDFNLAGFVEDILQVAPATTNIAVVIGATPFEDFWTAAFRRGFEPFTNRVNFTWLNELSLDQMLERVGKLPPHSFIFVALLLRDVSGVTHNADEALKRIHAVANAPVNSIFQHQLGLGIVGGRLYQAELEGAESARIAIRILQGEKASSIPPKIVGPLPPQYDWRELRRWNISENRLPPGSLVKFRAPTAWELYRWPITGTILFCVIQATLIVSLLVNRAKRRQGEAEATLIADISSKFVNLPPGQVDREIVDAQRRIVELLDLDVSGLWQWSAKGSRFFRLTHYSRPGEGAQIPVRMNSQEYFPWYQEQVLAGRTIAVASVKDLPPEAARDRETFRQFGFKSNLTIPLSVGGEPPIGALGFNTTRVEREWPEPLVTRLQLVAEIFANALARKRADEALRESEERMRMSQQAARVGMFDWNIKTGVNVWTPELEAVYGLAPGGFAKTQAAWESLVHPDDRAEAMQKVARTLQTGLPVASEWRVIWRDGSVHWLFSLFRAFKDETGEPVHMSGVSIDITERKRTEQALQESESRFRTVADTAPVMIWMSGADRLCNFLNKGWLDFTGRKLEAELGNGWVEGVHPDDRAKCLKCYAESFDARRPFTMEYRLRRRDGEYRWITDHGVPHYGSAQIFLGYIGSCLDITERTRAEAKFRLVVEASPNGIVLANHDGRILLVNAETERLFGYTREELVGHALEMLLPERLRGSHPGTMGGGREQFARRKDGTEFPVEIGLSPIQGEEGLLVLTAIVDITARKRAEVEAQQQRAELTHLSRVNMLGELAGSLAHELNQPLTAVLSNAQAAQRFLARDQPNLDEVREILADIVAEDKRAGEIIRRLRSLLKKGEVQHQPLNMNEIVHEVLKLVRSDLLNQNFTAQTDLAPDVPRLRGDRVQLQQVLLNLVMNACDAMAGAASDNRRLTIHSSPDGDDSVRVSVADCGAGIDPEKLEQVFEPFYTTKPHGLGLGLAVCRTIISAHGGKLWATRNPGRGATFHFTLPVAKRDRA